MDLEDVGMFLVQLTNRDFLQSKPENIDELDNCHDTIAYALCNQIIAEPLSFHVKLHTKLLGNLRISIDDFTRLKVSSFIWSQLVPVTYVLFITKLLLIYFCFDPLALVLV